MGRLNGAQSAERENRKDAVGLVSIVIPTFNSGRFIDACLSAIAAQTYARIETIVVDGFSSDDTVERAERRGAVVYRYGPDQARGRIFGAPYQRNYGIDRASGEFVYYLDVDMELTPGVVRASVEQAQAGAHAVIVPEDSFGEGFWAHCKQLERRTYWGDDLVEAPRFFRRTVWRALGGLDTHVGGGGDDWDLYRRFIAAGYTVARVPDLALHNEGRLTLRHLMRKRYLYGKSATRYIRKHGLTALRQFAPMRASYVRHARLFLRDPVHALGFFFMRICEYTAGAAGVVANWISPQTAKLEEENDGILVR